MEIKVTDFQEIISLNEISEEILCRNVLMQRSGSAFPLMK